jgi:predicted dienelactone hydrolase
VSAICSKVLFANLVQELLKVKNDYFLAKHPCVDFMNWKSGGNRRYGSLLQGLLCSVTIALGWGALIPSSWAAERVTLRLGPFQQSIEVTDLERFAKTGKLPDNLQIYGAILTPQIREILNSRLDIDPAIGDKLIAEVMRSPTGKRIVDSISAAIPGSSIDTIQAAIALAARQANGLNAISFLRAYPEENITIDATKAVALAVQFNPSVWQSQALGPLLEEELAVNSNTPFRAAFDPAATGKESGSQETITLRDRQRNRSIPVDIYYSRGNSSQNPLVVISHGFGASRSFFSYLARHLASHGITVVAVEHIGSNVDAVSRASNEGRLSQMLPASEFVDRPKDISFVLDELAKLNTQPGQWQGKFNTEQVSVIGHSLGGYTALALVGGEVNLNELRSYCQGSLNISEAAADWLQCAAADLKERKLDLEDKRVKSAIALNPVVGRLFGKDGLKQVTKPVLMVTGTEDALTPSLNHQLRPFSQLSGNKYLLTAIGATHLSVGDPTAYEGSRASTLVREKRGEETKALRKLLQGVSLAFVKQQTSEARIYQPFLTPAYAQSLSTPQLPLRLNSDIPGSVKPWLDLALRLYRDVVMG